MNVSFNRYVIHLFSEACKYHSRTAQHQTDSKYKCNIVFLLIYGFGSRSSRPNNFRTLGIITCGGRRRRMGWLLFIARSRYCLEIIH